MTVASDNPFPWVLFAEHVDPATPPADHGRLFLDTDGILKWISDAGVVTEITSSVSAAAHIADTSAAHAAASIGFTPNGSIAATDVQAAIQEVRDEASGGAPSTVKYLVDTLDAGLSAEVAVPHLYRTYSPDNYPTAGLTLSDEFDDSSLDAAWTWDTAPGGTVSESTYPGFLYLTGGTDASATQRILRRAFVPGAAAFSVAAKVNLALENGNYSAVLGIRLVDSSDATIWQIIVGADGTATASDGYRIISTVSTWITAATVPMVAAPQYMLITRSAANVYKAYISSNGIVWQYIGTSTVATAVAKVCIAYGVDTDALDDDASVDFVRVFTTETKKIGA